MGAFPTSNTDPLTNPLLDGMCRLMQIMARCTAIPLRVMEGDPSGFGARSKSGLATVNPQAIRNLKGFE